jgi:hypothetical protein
MQGSGDLAKSLKTGDREMEEKIKIIEFKDINSKIIVEFDKFRVCFDGYMDVYGTPQWDWGSESITFKYEDDFYINKVYWAADLKKGRGKFVCKYDTRIEYIEELFNRYLKLN